jgi:hypothetical protein
MDLAPVGPICQPEIGIGHEIRGDDARVKATPAPPDLAAPEGGRCNVPVAGHEALRGALVKNLISSNPAFLNHCCGKGLIGIRQGQGLRQSPGVGQIEGFRMGLKGHRSWPSK